MNHESYTARQHGARSHEPGAMSHAVASSNIFLSNNRRYSRKGGCCQGDLWQWQGWSVGRERKGGRVKPISLYPPDQFTCNVPTQNTHDEAHQNQSLPLPTWTLATPTSHACTILPLDLSTTGTEELCCFQNAGHPAPPNPVARHPKLISNPNIQ